MTADPLAGPVSVSEDDETEAIDIVYAWLGGDQAARTLLTHPEYGALTASIAQALAGRSARTEAPVRAALALADTLDGWRLNAHRHEAISPIGSPDRAAAAARALAYQRAVEGIRSVVTAALAAGGADH